MSRSLRGFNSGQLLLDLGGDQPSGGSPFIAGEDPVFFAILPEPPMAWRIRGFAAAMQRQQVLPGKLRGAETLHISLLGLGWRHSLSDAVIDRAKRAASVVEMRHFRVSFDQMASFGNGAKRPLVLSGGDGVAGVHALRSALRRALADEGLELVVPPLTPHISLLYGPQVVPTTELDEPLSWIVKNFALVHSHRGEGRYDLLGEWPLLGPVSLV